ncbi:MAG: CopG family transcriptional regulator [Microthrixaceae bacterium]|nr:CopG family transcriptional regulator [Microthrixaceae bacterium]
MIQDETINGVPVTEAQITEWATEAESGFDVEVLKKRSRGRPGRGAEPSQVIALRLTAEEIRSIDARAEREGKSRSEVIREALVSD